MKKVRSLSHFLLFLVWFAPCVCGQGLPYVSPENVGMSLERLRRISPVMEQYVEQNRIAGAVTLIARHGKTVYLNKFGMMDIEADKSMRTDAIFRIASMSKPITCTAIMILLEEGHFLLSDPISKFIPEFRNPQVLESSSTDDSFTLVSAKREITIKHLLNHTSGITYGSGSHGEFYRKAGISSGLFRTKGTIGEMVKKLAGLPLNHHPGDGWSDGLSQDVLGYLIEVVSGMPLDKFLQKRIFEPLGMKDTFFYIPEDKQERLTSLYSLKNNSVLEKQPGGAVEAGFPGERTYFSGGGGLCSTISDYVRFSQMLLNRGELDGVRILSRKTVELMTTDSTGGIKILQDTDDTRATHGDSYGLGLGIRTEPGDIESQGTFGWGGAFYTLFWIDPKEDLIGIFMTQLQSGVDKSLHRKFRILAYQAIVD